jgi:hypothetical protein
MRSNEMDVTIHDLPITENARNAAQASGSSLMGIAVNLRQDSAKLPLNLFLPRLALVSPRWLASSKSRQ